jgi:hypothetical protein
MIILSGKRLKKICQDYYSRGFTKGYELGYQMAKSEKDNRGFIIGSKVNKEIEELLKKHGLH